MKKHENINQTCTRQSHTHNGLKYNKTCYIVTVGDGFKSFMLCKRENKVSSILNCPENLLLINTLLI